MKKIILIAFVAIAVLCGRQNVNAQITLEHSYDSAYYNLYMVNLEVEGMKYIFRDFWFNNQIVLYNLDHSVFKIIPFINGTPGAVLYVSEHLFNTNDKIEYMWVLSGVTKIIDEDSNVLFSDSLTPIVMGNVPQEQQPIYNTPSGTKMILSRTVGTPHEARVYGLGGTLTNSIEPVGLSSDDLVQLKAFPNPNDGNVTIEFKLPPGIHSGEIVLYNMDGSEIKRFQVDDTFGNLILNSSEFSTGTYMYQLVAGNKAIDTRKMIVIH